MVTCKRANKFNEFNEHIGQTLAADADRIVQNISVKDSMFVEPTTVLEITVIERS